MDLIDIFQQEGYILLRNRVGLFWRAAGTCRHSQAPDLFGTEIGESIDHVDSLPGLRTPAEEIVKRGALGLFLHGLQIANPLVEEGYRFRWGDVQRCHILPGTDSPAWKKFFFYTMRTIPARLLSLADNRQPIVYPRRFGIFRSPYQ